MVAATDTSPRAPSPRKPKISSHEGPSRGMGVERDQEKPREKAVPDRSISALSRSVDSTRSNDSNRSKERSEEISDIDKRILALRAYLDNARNGILEES